MKVRVHFYAQLRDLAGTAEREVELGEGARISDLLELLYEHQAVLRQQDRTILVGAGLEFVDRDYALREGEEIAIMPPVQGG